MASTDGKWAIRDATASDAPSIQRALYEAVTWQGTEGVPPIEVAIEHPEMLRYHEGWGRTGDIGVIAEVAGETVGAAYGRLFTVDDHGHGFIDPSVPELAIAVWRGLRGQGIGSALMHAFHVTATVAGYQAISLSVDKNNPAAALYRSLDYIVREDDGDSLLMVKALV